MLLLKPLLPRRWLSDDIRRLLMTVVLHFYSINSCVDNDNVSVLIQKRVFD